MNIVKKLWWFFKLNKKQYFIAIFSLILVSILNLIPPKVIGIVIDKVATKNLEKTELLLSIFVILVSAIFMYILRYIWRVNLFSTSEKLVKLMRNRLYEHFTNMPVSFYQKYRTGDLMARVTNDVNALNQTAGPGVMAAVDSTITIIITLFMMFFTLSFELTILVLIPMFFIVLSTKIIGKKIHTNSKENQKSFSDLNNSVQESITGIKVTKSFNYEHFEIEKFKKVNYKNFIKNLKVNKTECLLNPIMIAFTGVSYVISLTYGSYLISLGVFSVGNLVTFIAYLDMLLWPLLAMGYLINLLQRGGASYGRIEQIFAESSDIVNKDNAIKDIEIGKITYNIDKFCYGNNEILSNINFSLEKGQTLGIVGGVGSGKTTLLKLLLREIDVSSGFISINDINIKDYDLQNLRNIFGYVPQEQILFSTSVRENIIFANKDLSDKEVISVSKLCGVYDDIMNMPYKFDTIVGEKGVSLSGGQKQRIAISRALILNPEILILDDSLSAVDAKTEDLILDNLKKVRKDKTTIITSHRLSSIVHSDLIIVLKDGKILEKGTHMDLMSSKNWYYETYNKQKLESDRGEIND